MTLPFTASQFLEVFARYNQAMWPAAVVLPVLGLVCAWLILARHAWARRVALVILGVLWIWTAAAYHLAFFARINPAARWFAALAAIQGVMFAYAAFGPMRTAPRSMDASRATGAALIAFALVIYPALGYVAGHRYPAMPTFGLPCPTTIFTLGVLAALHDELSWKYAIIPLLWSAVGTTAALQLGMVEDLGLPLAAIAYIGLIAARRIRSRPTPHVHAPGGVR